MRAGALDYYNTPIYDIHTDTHMYTQTIATHLYVTHIHTDHSNTSICDIHTHHTDHSNTTIWGIYKCKVQHYLATTSTNGDLRVSVFQKFPLIREDIVFLFFHSIIEFVSQVHLYVTLSFTINTHFFPVSQKYH